MDTTFIPFAIHAPQPVLWSDLSFAQKVARLRRPLPSHTLEGGNFRQWAAAVCTAEVRHRERDYLRVERELGVTVDRWDSPSNDEVGQFPHEAHAADALNWLSHLLTHESERRAAWDCLPFDLWTKKRRADWLTKRRVLWAGFVRQVERYRAARVAIDAPVVARAA